MIRFALNVTGKGASQLKTQGLAAGRARKDCSFIDCYPALKYWLRRRFTRPSLILTRLVWPEAPLFFARPYIEPIRRARRALKDLTPAQNASRQKRQAMSTS
jgi:hypothetical protein